MKVVQQEGQIQIGCNEDELAFILGFASREEMIETDGDAKSALLRTWDELDIEFSE